MIDRTVPAILAIALLGSCLRLAVGKASPDRHNAIGAQLEKLRTFEGQLQLAGENVSRELAAQLLRSFDSQIDRFELRSCSLCQYYRARLLILAGRSNDAVEHLTRRVAVGTVTPEVLSTLKEIVRSADNLKAMSDASVLLGTLLPLGVDGATSDAIATRRFGDGEFPVIPSKNEAKMRQIAEDFGEMQVYEHASRAYKELLYGTFMEARVLDPFRRDESWLSPAAGGLWLKVAESEWRSGRPEPATGYLAKTIVFGTDADKEAAIKLLREIGRAPRDQLPKPAPAPDRAKLLEIAALYAEMNMHPRALEILREFREFVGPEADELQIKYRKEWEQLVRAYSAASDRAVLFGQEVYSKAKGFNFDITIPPPLRPEALEEVRKAFARDRNQK